MVRKVRVTRVKDCRWLGENEKRSRSERTEEEGRREREREERDGTNHGFPTDWIDERVDYASESFSSYFGSTDDGGVTVHACESNWRKKGREKG